MRKILAKVGESAPKGREATYVVATKLRLVAKKTFLEGGQQLNNR